ncbi:MAG: sigma-54-dependent Fis family transcriptional regulator [Sorangiineae bacterium PRO1]|nr:sigma-54-dependent Fis family transcriptional regulator [Sorangiineae bacterium PRO1]
MRRANRPGHYDRPLGAETEQAVRVTATGRLGCVYVVEDEPLVRRAVCRALGAGGFTVRDFETASEALAALTEHADEVDVLITDVLMPGKTGFDLLTEAHARWRDIPVLLMTGQATVSAAVEAMRLGAYDYLVKPVDPQNTLIPAVRRAIEHKRLVARNRFLESQLQASQRAQGLVGESAAMRQVGAHVSAVAPADVTVLVLGESGTGKELVARAVHQQSDRSGRPFVDVNCAALTDSLLESELFGHMKGAFTGATSARRGLFETASSGTLFMDEVGELAPTTQARLLRVLQEGTIRPVGSSESRKVNVRIIAATNRDLAKEVEAGRFRQDLYYRLNVFSIEIPPLRERREDIPALVQHFLHKHGQRLGRGKPHVEPATLEALTAYHWPGNVRELENTVERALVLCRGDTITAELLPATLRANAVGPSGHASDSLTLQPLADARDEFMRAYLDRVLKVAGGNVAEAARLSGMDASNFRRLVKRVQENRGDDGED